MIRKLVALFMVSGLSVVSVAFSGGSEDGGKSAGQVIVVKAVDVSLTEFRWEPAEIAVKPGDTVRFEQTSSTPHNVEFREVPGGTNLGDAAMGPYMLQLGDTYDVVIDSRFVEGVHNYVCTPHATMGMTGTITVTGG
jgi:plastocyanin